MVKEILYILMYAALNVTGAALIKWQIRGNGLTTLNDWMKLLMHPLFIIAFLLIILSALALFKALSSGNLSSVIPIANGINFILTIGVGYILFQDKLSVLSFLGFILIISGIIVLSVNTNAHA